MRREILIDRQIRAYRQMCTHTYIYACIHTYCGALFLIFSLTGFSFKEDVQIWVYFGGCF